MQKYRFHRASLVLILFLAPFARAASDPKYVRVQDVDWESIVLSPPAASSPEQQAEINTLLDLQRKRTEDEVKRCQTEASADAFYFAKVLGPWFKKDAFPKTAALLADATEDSNIISANVKDHFKRARPFVADPRIQPCVHRETSPSYPSGHAIRGILWGTILAEMFPEHRDDLMSLGKEYGQDRILAGVHYPSDVKAGQDLGAAIAKKLLESPQFKKDLEAARGVHGACGAVGAGGRGAGGEHEFLSLAPCPRPLPLSPICCFILPMSWEAFRLTSKSPSELMTVMGPGGADGLVREMLMECWKSLPPETRTMEAWRKRAGEVFARNMKTWNAIKKPTPEAFFANLLPFPSDGHFRQALVLCHMMLPRGKRAPKRRRQVRREDLRTNGCVVGGRF